MIKTPNFQKDPYKDKICLLRIFSPQKCGNVDTENSHVLRSLNIAYML